MDCKQKMSSLFIFFSVINPKTEKPKTEGLSKILLSQSFTYDTPHQSVQTALIRTLVIEGKIECGTVSIVVTHSAVTF